MILIHVGSLHSLDRLIEALLRSLSVTQRNLVVGVVCGWKPNSGGKRRVLLAGSAMRVVLGERRLLIRTAAVEQREGRSDDPPRQYLIPPRSTPRASVLSEHTGQQFYFHDNMLHVLESRPLRTLEVGVTDAWKILGAKNFLLLDPSVFHYASRASVMYSVISGEHVRQRTGMRSHCLDG